MPPVPPKSASKGADTADKHCAYCGRTMAYRRRWAACFSEVRYCSTACRRAPMRAEDTALEETIVALLRARAPSATLCPSEASRAVFGEQGLTPRAMQRTRYAANRLVAAGTIVVTQKGRVVDPSTARGPIRLKRAQLP